MAADEDRRSQGMPAVGGRVVGKVIKGGDAPAADGERPALRPPQSKGVLNSEDYEAMSGAKKILADASAQARQVVEEAMRQKEQVFAEAREAARAEVNVQFAAELAK